MSDSEYPCELCGEAWGFGTDYVSDGVREHLLCDDCKKDWEEKLGYSHKFKAKICPTCGHLRDLDIVRYTKDDPDKKQCSKCGYYFDSLWNKELCEECAHTKTEMEVEAEEELCPICKHSITVLEGKTISGWATEWKECSHCDWHSEVKKKFKLKSIELPKGVKPLELF